MGRVYTIPINVTTAVQVDIVQIVAGTNKSIIIHGYELGQSSDTDSEQLLVNECRGSSVAGSGGASVTPVPVSPPDVGFTGSVLAGNTTKATGHTILDRQGWNVLTGLPMVPVPKALREITGGQRWHLELATTPVDSLTINGKVVIEEIG